MTLIVLIFGLLAGLLLSLMMVLNMAIIDRIGFDSAEVLGYTSMVLAFLLVYFGIRTYRDSVLGGIITFWRALRVGLAITAIASVCYVATWQLVYYKLSPDFVDKYSAHVLEKARASGASQAELDRQVSEMARFRELYRNPLINAAITFIEPFPVGLVITLVSAGVLARRRRQPARPAREGVSVAV
jgi:hypothetical protein